ncbi:CRASP family complement regulator-acquiring lipoprotein [Borrelia hermsii]|nr:CRASP family complement regulator-acquiring lipoprotein [Borrelia hermsii]
MNGYLLVLSIVGLVLIACSLNGDDEHNNGKSKIDNGRNKYIVRKIGVRKSKSEFVKVKVKKEISSEEVIFNLRSAIVDLISREIDKIKYSELKIMSEPRDFYGLPFSYILCREEKFLLVCFNPECTRMYRRRFYASFDYNENKLEELGASFAKINLSGIIDLLNCIFSVVSCEYQLKVEFLIENMNLKRNMFVIMSIENLDYIKSNLEWLLSLRKEWNSRVDEMIGFFNKDFKGTELMLKEFNFFMNQRFKFLIEQMEKVGVLVDDLLELMS